MSATLFHGGRVHVRAGASAEALLQRDGRVAAVGSASDLARRNFSDRVLTRRIGILKRQGGSLGPAAQSFAAFLVQSFKAHAGWHASDGR